MFSKKCRLYLLLLRAEGSVFLKYHVLHSWSSLLGNKAFCLRARTGMFTMVLESTNRTVHCTASPFLQDKSSLLIGVCDSFAVKLGRGYAEEAEW